MRSINYTHASLDDPSLHALVHYHVRRALLGSSERHKEPHAEIMESCLEGPLPGAMAQIRRWSVQWAAEVAPGFDPANGPAIDLFLDVTSKGSLDVTWAPVVTQEQFNAAPPRFKRWMQDLADRPIAQRRDDQIYFIRDFDTLQWHLSGEHVAADVLELSRISVVALAVMMAELPGKLATLVDAHWQDVLEFGFSSERYGNTPVSKGVTVHDMWSYSKERATTRKERALAAIGVNADRLAREWDRVAITNPRVRTDAGRTKVVAGALGIRADQVDEARAAIQNAAQWAERPYGWRNTADPYPSRWGGFRPRR